MADAVPKPAPAPRPKSAAREFLVMLARQAAIAVPMAIFFGTIYGGGRLGYWRAYQMALVFAFSIGLLIWAVQTFLEPRFGNRPGESHVTAVIRVSLIYTGVSVFGAAIAAYVLHLTIMPGFLGSGRSVAVVGMYTLLFATLTTGLILAFIFHRDAIQRAKADQELDLARRIQRAFLISRFPERPRVEVHAVNISSRQVSGDFYDVVAAGDAMLLAIADVSGKGVAAALMSSMLQASLRTQAGAVSSVSGMLGNMNRLLCDGAPTGKFATFFLGRLDESTLRFVYSNAGHNRPLLRRRDGTIEELADGGLLLGIQEDIRLAEGSVQLTPGDLVLLYTDGISEAAGADNDLFGEERLTQVVRSLPPDLSAAGTIERVLQHVRTHLNGAEPNDDMTLVVLKVREEPKAI